MDRFWLEWVGLNESLVAKLDRYSGADIRLLRNQDFCARRNRAREWLGDEVQQNFAHLVGARADRVPLFILQQVNLALKIERKDHRFRVHLFPSAAPTQASSAKLRYVRRHQTVRWALFQVASFQLASSSSGKSCKTGSQQHHTCWFRDRCYWSAKASDPDLLNIIECSIRRVQGDARDYSALVGIDVEKVLAIRIYGKRLREDYTAAKDSVNRYFHGVRERSAIRNINVEDGVSKCRSSLQTKG